MMTVDSESVGGDEPCAEERLLAQQAFGERLTRLGDDVTAVQNTLDGLTVKAELILSALSLLDPGCGSGRRI